MLRWEAQASAYGPTLRCGVEGRLTGWELNFRVVFEIESLKPAPWAVCFILNYLESRKTFQQAGTSTARAVLPGPLDFGLG